MSKERILLSPPHFSKNEINFVEKLFQNQTYFNRNGDISSFEISLEKYFKNRVNVACLSSGTAAIHIALLLAGVKKNDDVLCQSFTFSASVNPILYLGARPIFIESGLDTWNMCPNVLEHVILDRIKKGKIPKAILLVHAYGMPAKIKEIVTISKKFNISLIEDAAEAMGSKYQGQLCGTFGDFGIISFNTNKIITTLGGGALLCKSNGLKERAIFLSTQSKDKAPYCQHSTIGYNYRMNPLAASIGLEQIKLVQKYINLRRANNTFYNELFKTSEGIGVLREKGKDLYSNYWLSTITIDSDVTGFSWRDLQIAFEKENIETRPLWKPMHLQPIFKECLMFGSGISEKLFDQGLCLPSGSNLTDNDKERISKVIRRFL